MPSYKFFCHNCERLFSKILALVDYEAGASSARTAAAGRSSGAGLPFPLTSKKSA